MTQVVTSDDNLPKLNIWSLQDSDKSDLLESVIRPADLENTTAVIVLDLEKPGDIMEQLKSWMAALSKCLFNIFPKMEPGVFDKMKQKILTLVKTYEEPQIDENGKLLRKGRKETVVKGEEAKDSDDSDVEDVRVELPLGAGVLKVNLGIPILVVCNKIDLLTVNGDRAKLLEENLDFIQKHVREYALQYGATVMFTSAKTNQDRNLDTMYQYILSRLYDVDFYGKPQ